MDAFTTPRTRLLSESRPSDAIGGRLRWRPGARLRAIVVSLVALLAVMGVTGVAGARPPGSIRDAAAGDGHLWWSLKRVAPEVPGASREGGGDEQLLMHHASVEPAPTERFVMRLRNPPEAIAAEGNTVALVLPPEGARGRLVLLLSTKRNEAVGHWYTEPRSGPRVLAPLDAAGAVLDSELAGGRLFVLLSGADAANGQCSLLTLSTDAGAQWSAVDPPPLDQSGVDAPTRWRLFRDGQTLCAVGIEDGQPSIARLTPEGWQSAQIPAVSDERERSEMLGAFSLGGRIVLAERMVRDAAVPSDAADDGAEAQPAPARIRLSILRQRDRTAWANFDEPARPWTVAPFGSDAILLEIDQSQRGVARIIAPNSASPGAAAVLAPPGFASGNWVHLPVLGMLSMALALAAVIFGSDAYLQSRLGRPPGAARPYGASLARRFTALAIDAIPALLACMTLFGPDPQRLLTHPLLSANLDLVMPAVILIFGAWLNATVGDLIFGRSLGKRAMGLVVIGRDGQMARRGALLLRAILALVVVYSPLVMMLALLNPRGDGPAEMLSTTAVVDEAAWRALGAASAGQGHGPDAGPTTGSRP